MEDGALTDCVARGPPDSQVYGDIWTVVSTDFKEKEARAYVRMNWKDMTPHSVALTLRDMPQHKYKDMTDEEFEALWYRMTVEEFHEALPAFLQQEDDEKAAEEAAKVAAAEAAKEAEEAEKEEEQAEA
jgi:predicted phosphoadenosine phosphosulfate sulfurtransferase